MLWTFKAFSEDTVWPLGFDADPNILYVRAYHQGFEAIFKVNLTDPNLTKELVYANEATDVEGDLLYSQLKKKSLVSVKATARNTPSGKQNMSDYKMVLRLYYPMLTTILLNSVQMNAAT